MTLPKCDFWVLFTTLVIIYSRNLYDLIIAQMTFGFIPLTFRAGLMKPVSEQCRKLWSIKSSIFDLCLVKDPYPAASYH